MIKELHVQNFKRFRSQSFQFRPSAVTLIAGGNNSGKSTLLQALAVWEFCRTLIETEKGRSALEGTYRSDGVRVNAENFSPVALPNFTHLWTNLKPRQGYESGRKNGAYTLKIKCKWDVVLQEGIPVERELEFGMTLAHDSLYVKPLHSTVNAGDPIPRCAYLPPFAGITAREERMSPAAQRRLIGRGLAGASLRNILFDLHQRNKKALDTALAGRRKLSGEERRRFYQSDPWFQLTEVLQRVFQCDLQVLSFNELYHTTIGVELFRGNFQAGRFTKFRDYMQRDIMVEGNGFLQWLSVYALAVTPEINVLLLDEPDAHLHPSLQAHLLDRLKSLARENNKQVLLATHSTEILRRVEPTEIYAMQKDKYGYLTQNEQRIGLFEGLGTEYLPKLDQLRQHRRVIFYEGSFDEAILRILANTLGQPLPANLVFWQFKDGHSNCRILFRQLCAEIQGLKGVAIRDRDSLELATIGANLTESGYPDSSGNGLLCRTWRRRHLENYLIVPPAIARAAQISEASVIDFIADVWGIATGSNFTASDCAAGLRDARGKEILYEGLQARNGEAAKLSVENKFGCNRHEIAKSLTKAEIAEDIVKLINEIHTICRT